MTDEERAAKKRREEAQGWKEKGNESYKAKRFEEAVQHYNK